MTFRQLFISRKFSLVAECRSLINETTVAFLLFRNGQNWSKFRWSSISEKAPEILLNNFFIFSLLFCYHPSALKKVVVNCYTMGRGYSLFYASLPKYPQHWNIHNNYRLKFRLFISEYDQQAVLIEKSACHRCFFLTTLGLFHPLSNI